MAVSEREVKNKRNSAGELTGKAGIVYDVNIKYVSNGKQRTHSKKGFTTKREALQYEAEMKRKLASATYMPPSAAQCKLTIAEYMRDWIERHGDANLRPSTKASYKSAINTHIIPNIGDIPLMQLTPATLDDLYARLSASGLSATTVKYVHRIMGVALEHARKYHYIESNPQRDTLTKFGKPGETPDPYTIEEMRMLLSAVKGTALELPVILAGLYGLRASECAGLRWQNVDLEAKTLSVVEQLPYKVPIGTKQISDMAPTKSGERTLPITEQTLPYLRQMKETQEAQRQLWTRTGQHYYDNNLVLAKPDGSPIKRDSLSAQLRNALQQLGLRHIRFHDLRHSAATNMHELTGDFYTVGKILGHSLKGTGIQLGISTNLEAVTAQYVDVRLERERLLLSAYHKAVLEEK